MLTDLNFPFFQSWNVPLKKKKIDLKKNGENKLLFQPFLLYNLSVLLALCEYFLHSLGRDLPVLPRNKWRECRLCFHFIFFEFTPFQYYYNKFLYANIPNITSNKFLFKESQIWRPPPPPFQTLREFTKSRTKYGLVMVLDKPLNLITLYACKPLCG